MEETVGAVPRPTNKEQLVANEKVDPRKLNHGTIGVTSFPTSTGVGGNLAMAGGGNEQSSVTSFSSTSALPSLSQGVPVDPIVLLNLLKMGQPSMPGEQTQTPTTSITSSITAPISSSSLGVLPSGHVPSPVTTNFGFPISSVSGSAAGVVNRNEQVPVTGTSSAASLPSLLKGIAANPTILLNILKMGQQSKSVDESQKISANSSANGTTSSSKSLLGAAPPVSTPLPNSVGLLQKPSGTLGVSTQTAPTVRI